MATQVARRRIKLLDWPFSVEHHRYNFENKSYNTANHSWYSSCCVVATLLRLVRRGTTSTLTSRFLESQLLVANKSNKPPQSRVTNQVFISPTNELRAIAPSLIYHSCPFGPCKFTLLALQSQSPSPNHSSLQRHHIVPKSIKPVQLLALQQALPTARCLASKE